MSRLTRLTRLAALLVAVVLAGVLPSSAAAPGVSRAELARWDDVRASATRRVHNARDLIGSGQLADAVRAAAALAHITPRVAAPPDAGSAPAAVPPALAAPVSRLLATVAQSASVATSAIHVDPVQAVALDRELATTATVTGDDARGGPSPVSWQRAVDRDVLHGGALVLAEAIDTALPALAAYASTLPTTGIAVDGCDVVDHHPALCIGNSGNNTYKQDYALLIDLGGNDVHANSAGGASPLENKLAAAVAIDLGGDDTYVADIPKPSGTIGASPSVAVQGAGTLGIGMLVDTKGDDSYDATTSVRGQTVAQGSGIIGYGLLADLAGNDRYRAANTNVTTSVDGFGDFKYEQWVRAQGSAVIGGGVLLDGGGNDSYVIEARTPGAVLHSDGTLRPGGPAAHGIAYATGGAAALFADAGGNDSVTVEAISAVIPPEETQAVFPFQQLVRAGGYAVVGAASTALTGSGATTWSLKAEGSAPLSGTSVVSGLGMAGLGGFGALSDTGGNDTYRIEALSTAVRRGAIDDSCACYGLNVQTYAEEARIEGPAFGSAGGVGLLEDAGGNDRYTTVASATALSEARDGRTSVPAVNPDDSQVPVGANASAFSYDAVTDGLGYGLLGGAGFVLDQAGDDLYESHTVQEARATAHAAHGSARRRASSSSGDSFGRVQGASRTGGYGELRDVGGVDTYRSTTRSDANAEPKTSASSGVVSGSAQASGEASLAQLIDIDGGTADVFFSVPEDKPCVGTRGGSAWADCGIGGAGFGLGVNQ